MSQEQPSDDYGIFGDQWHPILSSALNTGNVLEGNRPKHLSDFDRHFTRASRLLTIGRLEDSKTECDRVTEDLRELIPSQETADLLESYRTELSQPRMQSWLSELARKGHTLQAIELLEKYRPVSTALEKLELAIKREAGQLPYKESTWLLREVASSLQELWKSTKEATLEFEYEDAEARVGGHWAAVAPSEFNGGEGEGVDGDGSATLRVAEADWRN